MEEPKIEAIYFTGNDCSVCLALKPKLLAFFSKEFPNVGFKEINVNQETKTAADYLIFTIPVLILLVDGKEYAKFVRAFSLSELRETLAKLFAQIRNV